MGERDFVDFYELLQLSPNADDETIHRVFRHLAKRYHPDTPGGDAQRFNHLVEAHQTLTNPEARAAYDAAISAWHAGRGRLQRPAASTSWLMARR